MARCSSFLVLLLQHHRPQHICDPPHTCVMHYKRHICPPWHTSHMRNNTHATQITHATRTTGERHRTRDPHRTCNIDHTYHMISYENLTLSYENTWDCMRQHEVTWDIMRYYEKTMRSHDIIWEMWWFVHCLHNVKSWLSVNVYSTAFDNSVCWTYDYCLQMWLHNSFMMIVMSYLHDFWYYVLMLRTCGT